MYCKTKNEGRYYCNILYHASSQFSLFCDLKGKVLFYFDVFFSGLEDEGWFDPWSLLTALRSKAIHLGAEYVRGEVVGFRYTNREVKELGGSERQMKDLDGVEVSGRSGAVTRG